MRPITTMSDVRLPLSGVRVLDLTHDWAGPHATRMLADFGAEVIKVEYARRMDGMRGGRKQDRMYDRHPRWHQINRNKLSITLDLKAERDRQALRDLVRISDVLVENSRPGVLDRLGFSYEVLRSLRPDIVLLSMPAFGRTGPEAAYGGYGGSIEPLSGIQSLTAYGPGEKPRRIREVDVTNGVVGACAIMTALLARQRTGKGQWIECSQLEASTSSLIGERLLEYAVLRAQRPPLGNRHPRHAPHGCYRCAGDDKWVVIVVRSDAEWARLCNVMEAADLASDARYATAEGRRCYADELDARITRWTLTQYHLGVMQILQQAGIAAGSVLNVAELAEDPHLQGRGFFVAAEDGSGRYPGMPFRFSAASGSVRRRGPDLGEHNADVIGGLLGRPAVDCAPPSPESIGTAFDNEDAEVSGQR